MSHFSFQTIGVVYVTCYGLGCAIVFWLFSLVCQLFFIQNLIKLTKNKRATRWTIYQTKLGLFEWHGWNMSCTSSNGKEYQYGNNNNGILISFDKNIRHSNNTLATKTYSTPFVARVRLISDGGCRYTCGGASWETIRCVGVFPVQNDEGLNWKR